MHDSTAQMTQEFEGAILRSLFVGATSPHPEPDPCPWP